MKYVSVIEGEVRITTLTDEFDHDWTLAKTMFELSRTGRSPLEHFDPSIHTLEAIAVGILDHTPLRVYPIMDSEIPLDKSRRAEWEFFWRGGRMTVGIREFNELLVEP